MKDLTIDDECKKWGKKLAARHPEDLSRREQQELREHLSVCSRCSTAYAAFNALETAIRDLSCEEPLPDLSLKLANIPQDAPINKHLPTPFPVPVDNVLDTPSNRLSGGMMILQTRVHCADRFSEVLPGEIEKTELVVEDMMSHVLLRLFGEGAVDDVTICFPPRGLADLPHCSIVIRAQCPYSSFTLFPRTEEHMLSEVAKSLLSFLKELFLSVTIDSVTLSPSAWNSGVPVFD